MRVINQIDRFNLVLLALKHLNLKTKEAADLQKYCENMLKRHKEYIKEYGIDMPEISEFTWNKERSN